MKLTKENLEKVFAIITEHLENKNGGEFDNETNLIGAVKTVVDWLEEESKDDKIAEIKRIIAEWGNVSAGELELESSPVYKIMSKDNISLIERFNSDDVDVSVYIHEIVTDEFSVSYYELDDDTIDEILLILQEHDNDMQNTMDSCRDENY